MAGLTYLTIATGGEAEIEVKRSRFRCRLRRVEDEAAAREVVETARRELWDARHHCSAFVLGPDGGLQRSNDDGEPAGTAGMPMLEVLRGREVSDVVAVVTRWFGGTLLGSGGLVRAYSDAVRAALEQVATVRRQLLRTVTLEVSHAEAGRVEHDLRARGVAVQEVTYAATAVVHAAVPADGVRVVEALVAEVTGGQGMVELGDTRWADLPR